MPPGGDSPGEFNPRRARAVDREKIDIRSRDLNLIVRAFDGGCLSLEFP
jgi:hypothetical protein